MIKHDNPLCAADPAAFDRPQSQWTTIEDRCRTLVLDHYASAVAIISRKNECLFTLGSIDRYLHVAPGRSRLDFIAMARVEISRSALGGD